MLDSWLEIDSVGELIDAFTDASGVDIRAHGTTSDAETIRDTAVAQPLIVASSLVALRTILDGRTVESVATATAGHSVGEFAAAAVAGVLDDDAAVALVAQRARFMAEASAAEPTGMSAVVGGDPEEVLAVIEQAGLWPANVNSAGQIVAAGALDRLAALGENPPDRTRVIPLKVAGAFHTPFMDTARDAFEPVAKAARASDPRIVLLSNADGASYADIAQQTGTPGGPQGAGTDVLRRLAAQISVPVRWDLCQATLADLGVTGLLELAPGGVLAGLAKRSLKGVEAIAVKSAGDVDAARDLIDRHQMA